MLLIVIIPEERCHCIIMLSPGTVQWTRFMFYRAEISTDKNTTRSYICRQQYQEEERS